MKHCESPYQATAPRIGERARPDAIPSIPDVKLGPLPPSDQARYIYLPLVHNGKPAAKLSKPQKRILDIIREKPTTRSDLVTATGKRIGNIWVSLRGLDRRGLLAHIEVPGENFWGCPIVRHYYAPREAAGAGLLPDIIELGIRVAELAQEESTRANERQADFFRYQHEHCRLTVPRFNHSVTALARLGIEPAQPHSAQHSQVWCTASGSNTSR